MRYLVIFGILMLFSACTHIPVATDFNKDWDFSTVNSYAWLEPEQKLVTDPLVDNDLMAERIRRAVETELSARGMVKTDQSSDPDFLVSYQVSTKEKTRFTQLFHHFGHYPYYGHLHFGGGFGRGEVTVQQYTAGSFVINVLDPKTKKLVWHGVSERQLMTNDSPEKKDQYVRETIRAILEKFPPTPSQLAKG